MLVASMDAFDDFRRQYPEIQGSTDRFVGWEPAGRSAISLFMRDMGVHDHWRISRKEESEVLRARRIEKEEVVRRATERFFRCDNEQCLLAQLWPERLSELPRYRQDSDDFVCPSCADPLVDAGPRPAFVQLIVFAAGEEQFRFSVPEGGTVGLGRTDAPNRIGLERALPVETLASVSRSHATFELTEGSLRVRDEGSTNGTELRRTGGASHHVEKLRPGDAVVFGPRATLSLPGNITIERSGRRIGAPADDAFADDLPPARSTDRSTRRSTL